MFHHSRAFLRLLGRLVLVGYFVFALAVLGVRYWLLPNIDQFRPYIAQQLSLALDTEVSVAAVSAEWPGLNPSLALKDVVLTDQQGQTVFSVPALRAHVSWRSLFNMQPRFIDLQANGIDLTVRRDADQRLHVLGRQFDVDAGSDTDVSLNAGAIHWLASQQRIALHDTVIRWIDDTRGAPPLVLQGVTLDIHNRGGHHAFSLVATPPRGLGKLLDMRGDFARMSSDRQDSTALATGHGQLYVHVDAMQPLAWAPWLDVPHGFKSGQLSAKAWLQVSQARVSHVTLDAALDQGHWEIGQDSHVVADHAKLYLDGSFADFARILGQDTGAVALDETLAPRAGLAYRIQSRHLSLRDLHTFAGPLAVEHFSAQGQLGYGPEGWRVQADSFDVRNADLDARLHGVWRQDDSPAGTIDLQGSVARASVAAIVDYLPLDVDADAREWMSYGLAAGEIYDASVLLRGELSHFPFDEAIDRGDFHISGKFRNTLIDYMPPEGKELGWPALRDMDGKVAMRRAGLTLHVDNATMLPDGKQAVQVSQLAASINSMAQDTVLQIDGNTQGEASAYLGLMQHSPLGALLDGVFNHSTATGAWQVPLSLTIPLPDADHTTVKGHIRFDGGQVSLTPELPAFQKVQGRLGFTEEEVTATDLNAQFLGGGVSISGELGGQGKGLQLQGSTTAKALAAYVDQPGMQRLKGEMDYRLSLQELTDGAMAVDLASDLRGMALELPAPLAKVAQATMPLKARWQVAPSSKKPSILDVALGQDVAVRFLHKDASTKGPYFYAGTIGLRQQPDMLPVGMRVDLQYPEFDADAWQKVADEFSTNTGAAGNERPLLPDVHELRLQAQRARFLGLWLDELTYTVKRSDVQQWRADITSSQTAGTLRWREERGQVAGPVQADFHRLALGTEASALPNGEDVVDEGNAGEGLVSSLKIDENLKLPAINLKVKNLRLYGSEVGELDLVGVNQAQGQVWQLEKLTLTSPWATLSGTGVWRLHGPGRGLVLDANAEFNDVGKYFDQLGLSDVMDGGQGSLKGKLEWRNMPWGFSKADLNGQVAVALDKGRFQTVGSHSARLLELLSFQSFSRLARMDLNPTNLVKDGYPYDSLRGTLVLDKGIASTHDYRIIGPVGTIVLDGQTSLQDETLDARAVVIPNLDVSGAAIAAGIAINPIVGIGAFLTQWLLKAPLAKAMTVQYHIGGTWDEPEITERNADQEEAVPE